MTGAIINVNGRQLTVAAGVTLAAALEQAGVRLTGAAPFCAMGSCFACLVEVDGRHAVRACLEPVRTGMIVTTGGNQP
jgi:predicted molibdopterin-dependent oxidoreductase YjgC